MEIIDHRTKVCIKCRIEKNISNFQKRFASNDGFNNYCKICKNDIAKKSYIKNKSKYLDKSKEYYLKNRAKYIKYQKKYYQENILYYREYMKKYRKENKEKRTEYSKKYQKEHNIEVGWNIK
jgi:hypothetical protein